MVKSKKIDKKTKPVAPKVDTGLMSFVTVAHINGIPADPEQIRHSLALNTTPMAGGLQQ
jgi:hypothetical protein